MVRVFSIKKIFGAPKFVRHKIVSLPWARSDPLPNTLPILLADSDLRSPCKCNVGWMFQCPLFEARFFEMFG